MKNNKRKKTFKLVHKSRKNRKSSLYTYKSNKNKSRRKKYQLKDKKKLKRLFVLLIISIVLLSIFGVLMKKTVYFLTTKMIRTEMLQTGSIDDKFKTSGFLLMNETIVYAPEKGVFCQKDNGGERVPAQQSVGYIVSEIQQKQYKQQYAHVETQYEKKKNQLEENINSLKEEIVTLNAAILEKTNKLSQTSLGYQKVDLTATSDELHQLGTKRNEVLEKIAENESRLESADKQMKSQKESLDKKYLSGTVTLKAPVSGIVSFFFDGLEEQAKPATFDKLDFETIKGLKENIIQVKDGNEIQKGIPVFKVIDNYHCDVAFLCDTNSSISFEKGEKISYRINNNEKLFSSKIKQLISKGDEVLIIFSHDQFEQSFIEHRKIDLEIRNMKVNGILIPIESVVKVEGQEGIYQKKKGIITFVPLNIMTRNEKNVIASEFSGQGEVVINPQFIVWRDKFFPNHAKK